MAGHLLMINPRKRRKARKSGARKARKVRRSSSTAVTVRKSRKVKRYRRNPIGGRAGGMVNQLTTSLVDGAIGGGGALATEALLNLIPFPAQFKTGLMRPVTTAALGVGLGMAIGAMSSKARNVGKQMAQGAVTVAMYQTLRPMVAGKLPGLSAYDDLEAYDDLLGGDDLLGNVDDDLLAYDDMSAYDEMGAYENPAPIDYYD